MSRRALRLTLAAALLAAASAAWAQERADSLRPTSGSSWVVRVPSAERVAFHGVASYDAAGMGTMQMLYPVPTPVGALVAVLAHGLVTESSKQMQRKRIQTDADAVLQPYESVLNGLTQERLLRDALARQRAGTARQLVAATDAGPSADWSIETAPEFAMTADQRALVLDNAVRIYAPGSDKPAYAQTIRVVSHPVVLPAADAASAASVQAHWLADDGRRLVDQSAALLAESLDVAMSDVTALPPADPRSHRTIRYLQGGSEKMERGALLQADCDRLLIRTLRGGLMSVPVKPVSASGTCSTSATR